MADRRRYIREQLAEHHDLSRFDSGEPDLDRWLREIAADASARGYSRVYVWHAGDDRVIAYFTLSSYAIGRGELPTRLRHGEYRAIPALLLGKLALDRTIQGQRLTGLVIADVVTEAAKASQHAAARYLVVDAINERVATIYERFGFLRARQPDDAATIRLLARITDLEAALSG